MASTLQNEFHPDYVSPPGETLSETLETLGMFQAELVRRMGRPVKTINEVDCTYGDNEFPNQRKIILIHFYDRSLNSCLAASWPIFVSMPLEL